MVCTVGGSAEPIKKSILFHKPTHVVYVASPDSRKLIRKDIEADLPWRLEDTHIVTLTDFQDIVQCVQDMRQGVTEALTSMSLALDTPVIADITGGSKIMSAALTLVMMEFNSRFSYVGGTSRTKDGLGIVESGTETVVQDANPWHVLAVLEVRALAHSFNLHQFANAYANAQELAKKTVTPAKQKFYAAVADMVQGYMLWDSFAHADALQKLRQAENRLTPYAVGFTRLNQVLHFLKDDIAKLEILKKEAQALEKKTVTKEETFGRAYFFDLLSNAQRRAVAGHFDDAVARLYSAIEKIAKTALLQNHGIDNSHVSISQVPDSVREEIAPHAAALSEEKEEIKLGLEKSFLLLAAVHDPLGDRYMSVRKKLSDQLQARNMSLLAHGYLPIDKKKYDELLATTLAFLDTNADALPTFPRLDWRDILLP